MGLFKEIQLSVSRFPSIRKKNEEIRVIPRNEIPIILAALEAKGHHRKQRWSLFAEWMLQTGMRTGEVRALQWEDVDENTIKVHSTYTLTHGLRNSTKTKKMRRVPLSKRAIEILEELERESIFIFPWGRYAFQTFFRDKVDQLYLAGLIKHKYRPYDLRHVAISRWLEEGTPVAQAAKWAGNTSAVIWQHYANFTKEYEIPVL